MNKKAIAVLLACAVSSSCYAQKLISMDQPVYPAQDLLPGVSGNVMVALTVSAEGKAEGATVATSSGFPPLDKAALAAAATAKFQPRTGEAGTPVATKVNLPISFQAAPSPVDRPCVEFTNELTEFARFNPGADPIDMKSVAVIRGALMSGLFSRNNKGSSSMGRLKNLQPMWGEIVKQCTAEPQGNVLAVIRSSVTKLDY